MAQATLLLASVLNIKFTFLPKRIFIPAANRSEMFVLRWRQVVVVCERQKMMCSGTVCEPRVTDG